MPSADLTVVASSAWVTNAASATTVLPTFPAGVASGDVVYAVVHVRPSTAAVTTPANWTLVGTAVSGTTAVDGAGTGPTELDVYRRVAASALSGTETFTLTGSPNVAQGCMIAFRASGSGLVYGETWGFWTVPTTGTTYNSNVSGTLGGGTASGNLSLDTKDVVLIVMGFTDNAAAPAVTAVAASGATFGTITTDPATHGDSTTGNDITSGMFRVPITAGASTTAPTITASQATAVAHVGLAWRVRATIDDVGLPPKSRRSRYRLGIPRRASFR